MFIRSQQNHLTSTVHNRQITDCDTFKQTVTCEKGNERYQRRWNSLRKAATSLLRQARCPSRPPEAARLGVSTRWLAITPAAAPPTPRKSRIAHIATTSRRKTGARNRTHRSSLTQQLHSSPDTFNSARTTRIKIWLSIERAMKRFSNTKAARVPTWDHAKAFFFGIAKVFFCERFSERFQHETPGKDKHG